MARGSAQPWAALAVGFPCHVGPSSEYGSQLQWEALLSSTAGVHPAWLPWNSVGPHAAPGQAPAGIREALQGAVRVLSPRLPWCRAGCSPSSKSPTSIPGMAHGGVQLQHL